jgi:hypothetical protein
MYQYLKARGPYHLDHDSSDPMCNVFENQPSVPFRVSNAEGKSSKVKGSSYKRERQNTEKRVPHPSKKPAKRKMKRKRKRRERKEKAAIMVKNNQTRRNYDKWNESISFVRN